MSEARTTSDEKRLRVVVATGDAVPQRHLAWRLANEFDVVGIVVYAPRQRQGRLTDRLRRYLNPADAFRYLHTRKKIATYEQQASELYGRLFPEQTRQWPDSIPFLRVEDINSAKAVDFVRRCTPDILCVNGTNLLREPMLSLTSELRYGIVNLHTGLSPYSRGGNCNLFMLLEGKPELVGITVHYIDPGIDSGDIIITARAPIEPADTYEMIEAKNFRLGIDLMLVAVHQLAEGRAARVPQWEKGKLFLRRTGYVYHPSQRVAVNRLIERGMLQDYLENREERDRGVRLIGEHS